MRNQLGITSVFLFKLRESCRQIKDRKWLIIKSIQCHLRSLIFKALTRLNMTLFVAIGISLVFGVDAGIAADPVLRTHRIWVKTQN